MVGYSGGFSSCARPLYLSPLLVRVVSASFPFRLFLIRYAPNTNDAITIRPIDTPSPTATFPPVDKPPELIVVGVGLELEVGGPDTAEPAPRMFVVPLMVLEAEAEAEVAAGNRDRSVDWYITRMSWSHISSGPVTCALPREPESFSSAVTLVVLPEGSVL